MLYVVPGLLEWPSLPFSMFFTSLQSTAMNAFGSFHVAEMFDTRLAFQPCPRRTSPRVKTDTADKITSCLRGKIVVNLLVKVDIQFLDWESLGAV